MAADRNRVQFPEQVDIVHPIRTDPAQIRNQEVMHQHLLRRSLGTQKAWPQLAGDMGRIRILPVTSKTRPEAGSGLRERGANSAPRLLSPG